MKNRDNWRPSKFVYRRGKLIASRDTEEVDAASRLMVDRVAAYYDANLRRHARGRLVDLGCGKAPLYRAYADSVSEVTCVDWGNTSHENAYLDLECDLNKTLPFTDGAFDTVILSDVLEHIAQPEPLWAEISRILAPRGKVILNVPFYYSIHAGPYDYYRYTEFALRRFVEKSDLRLIQLESIGGAPEILADVLAKNVKRFPLIGYPLAVLAQWLTAGFTKTRFGRKVSRASGHSFPFGYFLIAEKPS
ncbi:MAG TPA: class I SAM-dependent methyltransferase [Gaiellaceae bacterium]